MERFNDEDVTEGISNGEVVFISSDALTANIKKIHREGTGECRGKSYVTKLAQKDSKQDIHSQVNNRKYFPKENDGPPKVLELKETKRLKVEDGVCNSFQ